MEVTKFIQPMEIMVMELKQENTLLKSKLNELLLEAGKKTI